MAESSNLISSLKTNLHFNLAANTKEPILETALIGQIAEILSMNYSYIINELHELDPLITDKDILINQIVVYFWLMLILLDLCCQRKARKKNIQIKNPYSKHLKDTKCLATIRFCIKKHYLERAHPLEVSLHFTYNHVSKSAISLRLHLLAKNKKKLATILANHSINPDSGIHINIRQAEEICYVDALSSFDSLNTSITLLFTSCVTSALPLRIILILVELEETLAFAFNLLKTILSHQVFYNRGSETRPCIIITDDSTAEQNALRHC
ncbi:2855_t:CDS:2 [Gigaspora margarita]|uniref:2855_t:CDS:1 n=1 Tax=Gigaspora margarita TaxID=4874 RepID=A0ABN7WIQ3_GIGMA|nr:2855_t:CDS:2 [Gigaspora margarita]